MKELKGIFFLWGEQDFEVLLELVVQGTECIPVHQYMVTRVKRERVLCMVVVTAIFLIVVTKVPYEKRVCFHSQFEVTRFMRVKRCGIGSRRELVSLDLH